METTVKEAKDYLLKIELLDTQINCMQSSVDGLRESLHHITPTLKPDSVTGGGYQDRLSSTIAKIVDLENEINTKIDDLVERKAQVIWLLEKVRNPDYLKVLHMRYVDLEKWDAVASVMCCTVRNVHKLHGRALQVFAKIMEEEKSGKRA